jgi:fructose-1,6-bisphosphatase/inositol monophosphatase family enzyme
VEDAEVLEVLHATADAVRAALDGVEDWAPSTARPTQYAIDVVADAAALGVLLGAGLGALSEESGRHHPERPLTAVVDPVDGSTNASRRNPWFATSLCVLDGDGPRAALVVNQASGERFEATRGGGARVDGTPLAASGCTDVGAALVGLSGWPERHYGWDQYRAFGAGALDICAVAAGRLDAYVDTGPGLHGAWDYLGGLLVCQEAGAHVVDGDGRPLLTLEHDARRAPVAAATPELLETLVRARAGGLAATP